LILPQQEQGLLMMYAGLSRRAGGESVSPGAINAWLADPALGGSVERHTLHLYRIGYITTLDGDRYKVTATGWEAVEEIYRKLGEGEVEEDDKRAVDVDPDVLILLGEWDMKAEAQHLAAAVFGYPGDKYDKRS
jgi:hypothetical protein